MTKSIFLIAGESSGDALGATLVKGLKEQNPRLSFQGIGGPLMEQTGSFQSFAPFTELAIVGGEIVRRLPQLLKLLRKTVEHIRDTQPDLLLTIDTPEFSLRVARQLHKTPIRKIHCVAPSVWAWRPKRAKKIAPFLDHLLTLLPFEPPYFEQEGLSTTFVGHPLSHSIPGKAKCFWERHPAFSPEKPLLVLLPGSRMSEIQALLPIFFQTARQLCQKIPHLQMVMPTVPHLKTSIEETLKSYGSPSVHVVDTGHADVFAAGTAALAASGTVSLELGLAELPHVVTYRVSPPVGWVLKKMIKTPHVSLPNILLEKEIVPECLQKDCVVSTLTAHVMPLLLKTEAWQQQKQSLSTLAPLLKTSQSFDKTAAQIIGSYLD